MQVSPEDTLEIFAHNRDVGSLHGFGKHMLSENARLRSDNERLRELVRECEEIIKHAVADQDVIARVLTTVQQHRDLTADEMSALVATQSGGLIARARALLPRLTEKAE